LQILGKAELARLKHSSLFVFSTNEGEKSLITWPPAEYLAGLPGTGYFADKAVGISA
jgi:hypothetical protein